VQSTLRAFQAKGACHLFRGWADDRTTDITDEDEKTRIASASFIAEPAASVAKLELRNEGKAGASQRKVLFANQIMP
jgi:hypothetical protein